jgi:hypothetical protein
VRVSWIHCVLAEWQLVRPRLVRSRLGLALLLLVGSLVAGSARDPTSIPVALAVRVGMLGAVLGVGFAAGSAADRAALALTLTHPTTAPAVAVGRWLAAVTAAGLAVTVALVAAGGAQGAGPGELARAGVAALAAAGAAAGAALALAWLAGNIATGLLFLYIAVIGALPPGGAERLIGHGAVRQAGALVLSVAPSVSRYQGLASGTITAWLHAAAWIAGGLTASALLARGRAP